MTINEYWIYEITPILAMIGNFIIILKTIDTNTAYKTYLDTWLAGKYSGNLSTIQSTNHFARLVINADHEFAISYHHTICYFLKWINKETADRAITRIITLSSKPLRTSFAQSKIAIVHESMLILC